MWAAALQSGRESDLEEIPKPQLQKDHDVIAEVSESSVETTSMGHKLRKLSNDELQSLVLERVDKIGLVIVEDHNREAVMAMLLLAGKF